MKSMHMWFPHHNRSVYNTSGVPPAWLPTCTPAVSDRRGTPTRQAVRARGPYQSQRWRKTSQKGSVSTQGPKGEGLYSSEGLGNSSSGWSFQNGCSSAERSHWSEGKHAGEEMQASTMSPFSLGSALVFFGPFPWYLELEVQNNICSLLLRKKTRI